MDDTPAVGGERPPALFRYRFANAAFDESQGVLSLDGMLIPVEPRPLRLLLELLRHANEVVTKEELFDAVWEGRATVDNVLANAVNKLRKALGAAAGARIVNLPRVGYRLLGPVERVIVGRIDTSRLHLQVGQPVPRRDGYRLERHLGSGGHGQVWLARHAKLNRSHVFKFASDADGLRAIKREFTLYRVLRADLGDRPGFAHLLDANFSESPFFLECEYGGQDLLAWAGDDDHLKLLSLQDRLDLFVKIAEAVAAAHSVGVLHKDIKPTNVLISGGPGQWVPVLTDFGSGHVLDAHRLEDLGLTAMDLTVFPAAGADDRAGTPLYLAPEVVAGQASTVQSDLYALGLMLVQMLVGDLRRPLTTGWQRDIADELLRRDITAATEGDPKARLGSVVELVERLRSLAQRHGEQQQREEQRQLAESAIADLKRRRSRRPWMAAVFGSLMLGLMASLWMYWRADSASQQALLETQRAQTISDFLNKDLLQAADMLRTGNAKVITMADVLARASVRAGERFQGQPRSEASVRRHLGEVHLRTVAAVAAATEFRTAITLLEPNVPANDVELLASRFGLAQALAQNYQAKEGELVLQSAERDAGSALLEAPSELANLARRARLEVMMELQQHQLALPVAKSLVEAVDRWPASDLADRFDVRQRLREVYAGMGDTDHANEVLAQIMNPPYSVQNVGGVTFGRARLGQARALLAQGKVSEAKAILINVRDFLTERLGPNALLVGWVNFELGSAHSLEGDSAQAIAGMRSAQAVFSSVLGPQHGFSIAAAANVAMLEVDGGRAAAGLESIDQLIPWFEAHGRDTNGIKYFRAKALGDLNRHAEALALLEAIDIEKLVWNLQEERGVRWNLQAERGRMIAGLGKRQEGLVLIRAALVEMRKEGAPAHKLARYDKLADNLRAGAERSVAANPASKATYRPTAGP